MSGYRSRIIFVRNWMAGSSVLAMLRILVKDIDVDIVCPEVDYWIKGIDNHICSDIGKTEYEPSGKIYYFRSASVLFNFIEFNKLDPWKIILIIQYRNLCDLLVSEFYGDTLRHFPPSNPIARQVWTSNQWKNILIGVDAFCVKRLGDIENEYCKLLSFAHEWKPWSYEELVDSPHKFLKKAVSDLQIECRQSVWDDALDSISVHRSPRKKIFNPRIRSNLEWPWPGRAKYVLKSKTIAYVTENSKCYSYFGEGVGHSAVAKRRVPYGARKISLPSMIVMRIWRFTLYPLIKKYILKIIS